MYELLVLSLLMRFPLHAYLISKISNDTTGPWEQVSRGTLSTLLNKLEKRKLIQETAATDVPFPSERSSRTFEITDKGKERFIELMLDTEKNMGNYQKLFHIKALYLDLIDDGARVMLVNHYLDYCQRALDHLRKQQAEFEQNPDQTEKLDQVHYFSTIEGLMQLGEEQWNSEKLWANTLKERIQGRGD
ncbi:Transcriptional regulator PadR-like family protein [Fictibacillus solisalsi]|uniref:Transcriptional regulator PadR-like family protein n=1 Tax=Fictibacillus solisalsi TaxID=459525 RepID=A0A1G9YNN4_9BACL|nr:PadR family transcriptional regulator [Fictibacillus solisalsi]SDN10789.1 Transcriptional regulator PadR-like family protein [Fictibacillus solisalsi]